MHIQRLPLVVALVTALLATTAPAGAARIYNLLPMPVQMFGQNGEFINPGQKSASLSWNNTGIDIIIHGIGRTPPICSMNWFPYHEISGGHYLIIGHHGYKRLLTVRFRRKVDASGARGPRRCNTTKCSKGAQRPDAKNASSRGGADVARPRSNNRSDAADNRLRLSGVELSGRQPNAERCRCLDLPSLWSGISFNARGGRLGRSRRQACRETS